METILRIKSLIFLTVLLVLIGRPNQLHAQNVWNGTCDYSWYNSADTEFYIYTAEELAGLAALVNGTDGATRTTFEGKTVKLMSDIWLNEDGYSITTANNWPAIGGYGATAERVTDNYFAGHFDGGYHVIYNLYCNKGTGYHAGLFGAIQGASTTDTGVVKNTIIRNAYIRANSVGAAFVAFAKGNFPIHIVNCLGVNIDVNSRNSGGVLSSAHQQANNSLRIENCAITGGNIAYASVPAESGGIGGNMGSQTGTKIINCYFQGTLNNGGASGGKIAGYNATITNCYAASNGGGNGSSITGTVTSIDTNAMRSDNFWQNQLTAGTFKADCMNQNNGYPIQTGILCGIAIIGATDICSGANTTLTATGWDSYTWSDGLGSDATVTVAPSSTTTYFVTGTTGPNSVVDSVIVNVMNNIVVTGTSSPDEHVTFNFQGGAANPYTQPCSNQSSINCAVTTDDGWYLTRLEVNGTTVETFDPMDVITTQTYHLNPVGSSIWDITAYVDNKYFITINTYALDDNGDRVPINGQSNGLVLPWGTSGANGTTSTHVVYYLDDLTLRINETDRYHIDAIEVNGLLWSDLDSVYLTGIDGHYTIDVIYVDECDILTLPYSIGFLGSGYPACWYRAGGSLPAFNTATSYQTDNSISFTSSSNYAIAAAARLAPNFIVTDLMVKFAFKAAYTSTVFEVGVMTDPEDATTFERVAQIRPVNTNWNEYTVVFSSYAGEGQYIAFRSPYGISGTHYLDDVLIDEIADCIAPFNLRITDVGESSAIMRWDMIEGTTNFVVEYEIAGSGNWTTVVPNGNFAILTGLASGTAYNARIVACDGETLSQNFITHCLTALIGTPYSVTNAPDVPTHVWYNQSYTQQIFLANELNSQNRDITGLSVQYTGSSYTRKMIIFLGHTTQNTFTGVTNFIPDTALTRVFTGNITFNNQGENRWVDIVFDTPFAYNGNDNLVVAFADTTGSYNGTSYFLTHATPEARALTFHHDGALIDRSDPTGTSYRNLRTYRNNIRFMPCPGASPCIAPFYLTATNVTEDEATISWVDDNENTEFDFQYKSSDSTTWLSSNITNTSVTLSMLDPGTTYNVRVRTICDTEDTTAWVTLNFTTETEMIPIQCDGITIPYTENFNMYAPNEYPECWIRYTSGYNNLPYITQTAADVSSSPSALTFGNTPHTFNMAILPEITGVTSLSFLQVSFRGKTVSLTNGLFLVGVMSDPNDIHTLEIVDTARLNGAGNFYDADISLANYTGSGRNIALIWKGGNSAFVIDDLIIDYIPGCQRPDLLSADNILWNKAYISWSQPGTSADSWEVEYGREGFTQGTGNLFTTYNSSDSITGLSGNTRYDIYVTSHCGTENSLSAKLTIQTPCGLIASSGLPFVDNFDTYGTTSYAFPICWTRLSTALQGSYPHIISTHYSSPGSLYFYSLSSTNYHSTAITPEFDVPINTLAMTFMLRGSALSNPFIVGVMTDPNDISTFEGVDTISVSTVNVFEAIDITLSSYTGTGRYIAFYTSGTSYYMDNLHIDYIPSCPRPQDVALNALYNTSAEISWTEIGTADEWEIVCVSAGSAPESGTPAYVQNTPQYTITGLTATTTYDVYVRTFCSSNDTSRWSQALTFTTECDPITTIPHSENFDGTGGAFPSCWYRKSTYLTGHPMMSTSTSYSPAYALAFYTTASSYSYAVTPRIGVSLDSLMVTFKTRFASSATPIIIGVTSKPWDVNSIVGIDTIYPNQTSVWESQEVYFNNYSGDAAYIVFKYTSNYTYLYLDNIEIDYLPTCWTPQQLSVTAITTQDVTIDWLYGDENEWEIEIGTPGFMPGTGAATAVYNVMTAPPYTITSLTENTSYDIYVRAICAVDDTSGWSSRGRFSTQCFPITLLPYYENFDFYAPTGTSDQSVMADCWSRSCLPGTTTYPYVANWGSGYTWNNTGYALDFNYTPGGYSLAVLPQIDVSIPINTLQISFYGRSGTSGPGTFIVGVMNTPSDDNTFIATDTVHNRTTSFQAYTFDFSSYTGSGQYIAFKWVNATQNGYYLDEVEVDYIGASPDTCLPPTNLVVSNITTNTARVTWTAGEDETEWAVEYKKDGDTDYTIDLMTTNMKDFTTLAAETMYEVCVKAKCGDEYSERICTTFTTLPDITTYTINASVIGNGTISPSGDIEVTEGANQLFEFIPDSAYKVGDVKIDGDIVDASLYPGNKYTFTDVRADATIQVVFVEDVGVIGYDLENRINLFPNPTDNMLNVKLDIPFETVEITNMLGQMIYKTTINDLNFSVNVSSFNAGVYFIKLAGETGTAVKKFVVK